MSDTESQSTPDVPLVDSDTADLAAPVSSDADVPPGFPLDSPSPDAADGAGTDGDGSDSEGSEGTEDDPQGAHDPLSVGTTEADVSDGDEQQA